MKFTSHFQTDVGRVRELNEDNVTIVRPRHEKLRKARGELMIVADGMGGHESGEVASGQAVETIKKTYYNTPGDPADALRKAIEEANRIIYERAQQENRHGMGTTVVAAAQIEDKLYITHVGDSRLYLLRGDKLYPLTRDHSLVAEQVAAGILTPEEAEIHPHRNVVSRAVGTSPRVEVEIAAASPLTLEEGDIVLICSDGLTEHVRSEEIVNIVQGKSPEAATKALIDAANAAGGTDNISIIVGHAGDPSTPAKDASPPPPVTSEEKTSPLAVQGEDGDGGKQTPEPERRQRGKGPIVAATIGLLTLLVLGGAGVWSWSAIVSVPEPTPTATPENQFDAITSPSPAAGASIDEEEATTTPTVEEEEAGPVSEATATRTPRPTETPTPSTMTPETDATSGQVTIRLLEPEPDREVDGQSVTFRATISNMEAGDQPQLRMGREPDALSATNIPLLQSDGGWEVKLQQPPGGLYGDWYWTVALVTDETAPDGGTLVFRASPPRHLIWNRPASDPESAGDSS